MEFCSHGAQLSAVLFILWHLNRDGSAPETGHSPHWDVHDAPSCDFSTPVFTPICLPGPHPLCSGLTFLLVPRLASLLKPPFVWVADLIQVWKRQKAFHYKQHKMILDFLDLKTLSSPAQPWHCSLPLQIPSPLLTWFSPIPIHLWYPFSPGCVSCHLASLSPCRPLSEVLSLPTEGDPSQCFLKKYVIEMLCVLSHLCPTLCNPMDYNPPGSSVPGILQARILEWAVMPLFGGSSRPRAWTHVSYVSCISSQVLYYQPPLQKPKRDATAVKITFFHTATTVLQLKTLSLQEIKQPVQDTWLLGHLGRYLKALPASPPPSCWTLRGLQLVGVLSCCFLCVTSPVLPGHRLLQQGRGEKAVMGPTFHHSPL